MSAEKLDLFKQFKAEYAAAKKPTLIDAGKARYLAVSGRGDPNGAVFTAKLEALYSMAYALKMAFKNRDQEYVVCKLEGLWWGDLGLPNFTALPRDTWNWTLLIRTPDFVTPLDIRTTAKALLAKGKTQGVVEVAPFALEEGRCVQMLHLGPYQDEYKSIATMLDFVAEQKLHPHGLHHEIYLSDPRRTAPEKLKTILRIPVAEGCTEGS